MTLRGREADAYRFVLAARRVAPSGIVTLTALAAATKYRGGLSRLRRLLAECPRLWTPAGCGRWLYRSDRAIATGDGRACVPFRVTDEPVPLDDGLAFRRWLTHAVARCTSRLVAIQTVADLRGIDVSTASRHLSDAERTPNALDTRVRCRTQAEARTTAWEMTKEHGGWFYAVNGAVFRRLAYSYAPLGEPRVRRRWSPVAPLDIRRSRLADSTWEKRGTAA